MREPAIRAAVDAVDKVTRVVGNNFNWSYFDCMEATNSDAGKRTIQFVTSMRHAVWRVFDILNG